MSGGKYRRSREAERQALRIPEATVSGMACLAKKGRAPGLYRGEESATISRQIDSLSPEERAGNAGRRQ